MTSRTAALRCLLLAACLVAGAFVISSPLEARAQERATDDIIFAPLALAPADSAALAAAIAASDSAVAAASAPVAERPSAAAAVVENRDRVEVGVAMPEGYFDWLGTLGYRRNVLNDARFKHWLQIETTFGKKEYLSEGSASVAWYMRPHALWRPEWRIRPVVEGGIGGYIVVQFADIVGFEDWSSHARAFVKGHAVAGLETNLSDRFGLAIRGRFTIPANRPLDYAQLVLFLR
ncbi:MAG: hypothetical protein AAB011_11630 [Candidatus Eisenbacteria bacterium]